MNDQVKIVAIEFRDVNLPSFNTFYSQKMKAKQRSETVWKWKIAFSAWIRQQLTPEGRKFIVETKPLTVAIYIHKAKGTRWFDVDNCTMYGKLFLDTLKSMKLIKDDSPHYIKKVSYTVELNASTNKIVYLISKHEY